MIMKKVFPLLLLIFVAVSCGGYDTQSKVDEVLSIHDEVMPKMGEVMNLKRQVLAEAQKVTDSAEVTDLRTLAKELDDANSSMMVWMREWSKNSQPHVKEETTIEEREAFFQEEMEKVLMVKENINNSIAAAKKKLQ